MNRLQNILVAIVILLPAAYLAWVWNRLPEQVALHFDWKGNPDRFGSKRELLVTAGILTGMSALVYLLLINIYRIDPKRYAAENKGRLRKLAFALVVFLSALLCLIIYSSISGNVRLTANLILSGTGLLFAVIGNYLPNLKPNYFAGFRLPWTLENEENWRKTHALAGRLWFAGGLLLALVCLLLPATAAFIIFCSIMGVITLIPIFYSYRLFREQKKQQPLS